MVSEKATMTKIEDGVVAPARKALPAFKLRYDALLVFITMIWGSPFLVVKNTIRVSGPFTYLAFAYGVGALTNLVIMQNFSDLSPRLHRHTCQSSSVVRPLMVILGRSHRFAAGQ